MSEKDEYFMFRALAAAEKGRRNGQTPFGACIVKNGKIVACTHNKVWSNTDITAHAEITAIRAACKKLKSIDLSGCTIYSTTEPCPMCFSACHWARIDKIVYGASISDAKKAGFNELQISDAHLKKEGKLSVKLEGAFLKKENQALFRKWCAMKHKGY